MWYRTGTITLKKGTNKVLGIGTKWQDKLANVEAGQPLIVNNNIYEITQVKSDTELYIKELALEDVANSAYVIMSVVYGSLGDVALKASKALAHHQEQMQVFDQMYSGTEPFTVIKPDGTQIEMYPYSLLSVNLQDLNQTIQTVASYATNAENSANHAQSSASEAGQYALDASNSAKQSKDSSALSAESASKSLQSANDSASSANNASQSASQAKQSEETALSHANNAQSSASSSAQSASESKVSAEEAKQAALSALSGFNKDLLIQEFEALSNEEKQVIKDHLKIEIVNLTGYMKGENNLSDVKDKDQAKKNLGIVDPIAPDLTGLLAKENNLSDVPDKAKARENLGITTPDLTPLLNKSNNLNELTDKKKALENLNGIPWKINYDMSESASVYNRKTIYLELPWGENEINEYFYPPPLALRFAWRNKDSDKSSPPLPFDENSGVFINTHNDVDIFPAGRNSVSAVSAMGSTFRSSVTLNTSMYDYPILSYTFKDSSQYCNGDIYFDSNGLNIAYNSKSAGYTNGYAITTSTIANKNKTASLLFVAKTAKPTGWNDGADIAGPNLTPVQPGTWTIVSQFDTGATGNRYVYLFVRKY